MIDAAVFARDVAYCAFCFTGDDLGLIADTGQGVVRHIHGRIRILRTDAWFDMIAGQSHTTIANLKIIRDPAGRRQNPWPAVAADTVLALHYRRMNLALNGLHD